MDIEISVSPIQFREKEYVATISFDELPQDLQTALKNHLKAAYIEQFYPYSVIGRNDFKRYSFEGLVGSPMMKRDGFSSLPYTWDGSLPQDWLNDFVDKSGLDYHLVLSTTAWAYPPGYMMGTPISFCVEVQDKLEELYYSKRNG